MTTHRRGGVRRRRSGGRKVHHRRSGASVSAGSTVSTLAIGGLAVGFADGKGYLAKLPTLGGSKAITLGVAGFVAVKYGKNKYLKAAGLAALASAAFDYGRVQASGGKLAGLDDNSIGDLDGDDLMGDLDGAGERPNDGGPY